MIKMGTGERAGRSDHVRKSQNLLFEGQMAVDMRVVCPQDVMKMLLKAARMACRKNCADTSPRGYAQKEGPSGHGHTGTSR